MNPHALASIAQPGVTGPPSAGAGAPHPSTSNSQQHPSPPKTHQPHETHAQAPAPAPAPPAPAPVPIPPQGPVSEIGWPSSNSSTRDILSSPRFVLSIPRPPETFDTKPTYGHDWDNRSSRFRVRALGTMHKNVRGDPQLSEGIPRVIEIPTNLLYAPDTEKTTNVEPGTRVELATVCKRARQFVLSRVKEWADTKGFLVHLKGTAEGNAFLISCHRYGRKNERNPARCGCQWVVRYVFESSSSTAFIRSFPHHDHNHSLGKKNTHQGGILYIEGNRILRSERTDRHNTGEDSAAETEDSCGSDAASSKVQRNKRPLASSLSTNTSGTATKVPAVDLNLDAAWSATRAWAQPSFNAQSMLLATLRKFPMLVNDAHFRRLLEDPEQSVMQQARVESPMKQSRLGEGIHAGGMYSNYQPVQLNPDQTHFQSAHTSYPIPDVRYQQNRGGEGFPTMHQMGYDGRPIFSNYDASSASMSQGHNDRGIAHYHDYSQTPISISNGVNMSGVGHGGDLSRPALAAPGIPVPSTQYAQNLPVEERGNQPMFSGQSGYLQHSFQAPSTPAHSNSQSKGDKRTPDTVGPWREV